jgi:hypothetical protein
MRRHFAQTTLIKARSLSRVKRPDFPEKVIICVHRLPTPEREIPRTNIAFVYHVGVQVLDRYSRAPYSHHSRKFIFSLGNSLFLAGGLTLQGSVAGRSFGCWNGIRQPVALVICLTTLLFNET